MKFHRNFWLKRFNELPVKLLFWVIAIIPIITIFVELEYKSKVLNEMVAIIVSHIKYIAVSYTHLTLPTNREV